MCKVMDFAMEQGMEQGIEIGTEKGKFLQLYELTQNNVITIEVAAKSANLSVNDFYDKLKYFKII